MTGKFSPEELAAFERKLAIFAAWVDLRSNMGSVKLGEDEWYDSSPLDAYSHCPEDVSYFLQQLRYLEHFNLIEHHPTEPHLLRLSVAEDKIDARL